MYICLYDSGHTTILAKEHEFPAEIRENSKAKNFKVSKWILRGHDEGGKGDKIPIEHQGASRKLLSA